MQEQRITDDLEVLLNVLPPTIVESMRRIGRFNELIEIVLDLGRRPEARYVGIAALIWIELAVIAAIYRAIFKGGTAHETTARVQAETEMPAWVARLLVFEAMLWRRAWQGIKQMIERK